MKQQILISAVFLLANMSAGHDGYAQQIAGGQIHSLAICSDGTVKAWGSNATGQLGDGTQIDKLSPVTVSGLTGMTAVAGGEVHSLAVKSDGTVWAWGDNAFGQIGDATITRRLTPVQVHGPGNVGFLTGITAVAGGSTHSLALKSDGTVWAWGNSVSGQIGDGFTIQRNTPVQVNGLTGITAIAAGATHSLARKNDGTVWAWGDNTYGKLGDGTTNQSSVPVQVVAGASGCAFNLCGITAIAAGEDGNHSLALKNNGTVWTWGKNDFGQLGDGTSGSPANDKSAPVQVIGLAGIMTAVSAGANHSVALKNDGTVWAWGDGGLGKLGYGSTASSSTPVQVSVLTGITSVAAGSFHSLTQKTGGTLWSWGENFQGPLGNGTTTSTNSNPPVQTNAACIFLLPIELISFNVFCNSGFVSCKWETASEINNNYFSVERSEDGRSFDPIGTVPGAGNASTVRSYEFIDHLFDSPLYKGDDPDAKVFYRLKQTDFDGKYEYVGPVTVRCDPGGAWHFSLINIFQDEKLNGILTIPKEAEVNVSIIDLQGRTIKEEKINAPKSSTLLKMDLKELVKGLYIVKVSNDKNEIIKKFIKP